LIWNERFRDKSFRQAHDGIIFNLYQPSVFFFLSHSTRIEKPLLSEKNSGISIGIIVAIEFVEDQGEKIAF